MKRFISKTFKDKTSVIELELREVTLMEDQSLAWRLQPGEKFYEVVAPKSLAGEKYYSYFMHELGSDCFNSAIEELRAEAIRTATKSHAEVDEKILLEKFDAIEMVMLEGKVK